MAKRDSLSEPHPVRSVWLAFLLLSVVAPLAAGPVTAEFTAGLADARSFQALRLTVNLGGRERQVQLALDFPSGGRIAPDLTEVTAGGRVHLRILNVYVPEGTGAGAFTVRGTVIDGSRRWPFEATIRVRANAKLLVRATEVGFVTVRAEEPVHRTWRLINTGNVVEVVHASPQPATGARLVVDPTNLTLAPGETKEVTLSAWLEFVPTRLTTMPLFLNVDSGEEPQSRHETVGFTAEFVPREAGTGPLFAELTGEVLLGAGVSGGQHGSAGRLRVEGEVSPGVNLLAYGTDGTSRLGSSHLGLAEQDFLTVALTGRAWHATGGLVTPPSFGFLEPSTQGRGGTLGWSDNTGLTITALGAQDRYADFNRENAGLHFVQVAPDKTGWEAGLLAQRNQIGAMPEQQRLGGFAQANWLWHEITGASQIAAAEDTSTRVLRLGFEQRLDYRTADQRTSAAVFAQTAPEGFFLDGWSQQLNDATFNHAAGETGQITLHWSQSREQGLLRSYSQTETEAGLPLTDPAFVELITRTGSKVQTWSAGYGFTVADDRALLTYSDTDRTRDADTVPSAEDTYRERALTADWSRSFHAGQVSVTTTAAVGTEENLLQRSDFAEAAFSIGGQVNERLQLSGELRHTWHTGGSPNTGYRQPGTYGRGTLTWTPRPRWRWETGFDGYQFSKSAGRLRSYSVLEIPVTPRLSLATEVSHDGDHVTFWLAARVNFVLPMRWRPIRGAVSGRIFESGGGAPVAGARLAVGGRAGLTDTAGNFILPGSPPGSYPLTWSLPEQYLAAPNWPRTVTIRAGEIQVIALASERLAVLTGTVTITRGAEVQHPTGSISATDQAGREFETMAAAGDFRLLLPAGRYTVRYTGELSSKLAAQLVAIVTVQAAGESVHVRLAAVEQPRGMRRTYFEDNAPAAPP